MTQPGPAARGVRLEWDDLPSDLREKIETRLGGRVVTATTQPGGFSPGVAARLQTVDGSRFFVKAISEMQNPDSPAIHRREAEVMSRLPSGIPAPKLLGHIDEGAKGWVVLIFEDVDGRHPGDPWTAGDLQRVAQAIADLHLQLTPAPSGIGPPAGDWLRAHGRAWHALRETANGHLDDWSTRHLDDLCALEQEAPDAVVGETALHMDLRSDNILAGRNQVSFVDWPWVHVGASWFDMVLFAPSVTLHGGPNPETVFAMHPFAASANSNDVTAAVAALAGFHTYQASLPPPPGIPTVRAFQAAQGAIARDWLGRRTGWK